MTDNNQVDHAKIEAAVRQILEAVGEDPDREGLRETPARVARMYAEMFAGLHNAPEDNVDTFFTESYSEVVLVRDIPFASMCEHHLLPFFGVAHVAYIPSEDTVFGISKLARAVEAFARRPQLQERMTNQVADLLEELAKPQGVGVVMEASHTCMSLRGIKKPGTSVVTSALRGTFLKDPKARAELLGFIQAPRRH
ncbi:MAG: GTP cyclohydrolase I FolE [Planctomycetota bacterium]|jgi:GTP cyclohydrolase I